MHNGSRSFAAFMASWAGRLLRIVVGLVLIGWGWSLRADTSGVVIMILGLVPLLAGIFNVCVLAPIIGAPFSGRAVGQAAADERGPG